MAIRFSLPVPAAALLIVGCAAQGDFPSLAPRAVEGERSPAAACASCSGVSAARAPLPAAPAPTPDDAQLAARLSELAGRARDGDRAFTALLPEARRSIARAGSSGSEPWIEAQQLVSRLEAARGPTVEALAELDALAVARSQDGRTNERDRDRVLAVTGEIRALSDAQRAALDRLSGQLSAF